MTELYVNTAGFENIREIHEFLARELAFPPYYGKNLDALYDVLTDVSGQTRIIMDLSGVKEKRMMERLERMVKVMADAAEANRYLKVECIRK